jgi:hypothetical protein
MKKSTYANNDADAGTGSGTISRYRSPVVPEGPSMKDGSTRGRKPAKNTYGKSANVKSSEAKSFSKGGGKNPCKAAKK